MSDQHADDVRSGKYPFQVTVEFTVEAPDAGSAWCWVDSEAKRHLFHWPCRVLGVHIQGTHIDGDDDG